MKKLMIFAALAMVATFAQASSVDWKFNTNVSGQKGYTVYVVTSLPDGGFTGVSGNEGDPVIENYLLGTGNNSGTITGTRSPYGIGKTATGITANDGDTVSFYYVILDPNNQDAGYWTLAGSAEAYSTGTGAAASTISAADGAALLNDTTKRKTWSTGGSDVPEPTSGLLLALGGAMLALRRRKM